MSSSSIAVAVNAAVLVTAEPNPNVGRLIAAEPSALRSASTWAFLVIVDQRREPLELARQPRVLGRRGERAARDEAARDRGAAQGQPGRAQEAAARMAPRGVGGLLQRAVGVELDLNASGAGLTSLPA